MTKYYFQSTPDYDMIEGWAMFAITPKKYYDKEGHLSDRHFEARAKDIPKGFANEMESIFAFRGTHEEGVTLLDNDPLFEEKKMI